MRSMGSEFTVGPPSGEGQSAQKIENYLVELIRTLERGKMAYLREDDEGGAGDGPGQVLGVLALDELVMLGLHDRYRHLNLCYIGRGVVGLGSLHQSDRL